MKRNAGQKQSNRTHRHRTDTKERRRQWAVARRQGSEEPKEGSHGCNGGIWSREHGRWFTLGFQISRMKESEN